MFHANTFLNFQILLKNVFEKCLHQHSHVVKMNSLSYLFHCTVWLLSLNLFRMHFEQYHGLERSLFFGTLGKKMLANVIKSSLALKLQKLCEWIYNRSYMHATLYDPSSRPPGLWLIKKARAQTGIILYNKLRDCTFYVQTCKCLLQKKNGGMYLVI